VDAQKSLRQRGMVDIITNGMLKRSKEKRLKRVRTHQVILKTLKIVEAANMDWFEKVCIYIIH